jgi:hypothetical protein
MAVKSTRMIWAGHIACMGVKGNGGELKERDYLENLGADGR